MPAFRISFFVLQAKGAREQAFQRASDSCWRRSPDVYAVHGVDLRRYGLYLFFLDPQGPQGLLVNSLDSANMPRPLRLGFLRPPVSNRVLERTPSTDYRQPTQSSFAQRLMQTVGEHASPPPQRPPNSHDALLCTMTCVKLEPPNIKGGPSLKILQDTRNCYAVRVLLDGDESWAKRTNNMSSSLADELNRPLPLRVALGAGSSCLPFQALREENRRHCLCSANTPTMDAASSSRSLAIPASPPHHRQRFKCVLVVFRPTETPRRLGNGNGSLSAPPSDHLASLATGAASFSGPSCWRHFARRIADSPPILRDKSQLSLE
ncbi:hypothetical protein CCM_04491 [Cordyceps militaris CM01]|uniref:Uncharacterized protein n=1 Tax=Cordyceps militaris (strain CM01) TaxID=983644 RepID=G3JFC9_CORMM|nr:uncharacterized protein CCM_04491 [Cordyceps militaris CM01]EGX93119.1 hypothetical protein CCM_04491 [Cordyceps militaris CM01]